MEETTSKRHPKCPDCRRAIIDMGDFVASRDYDKLVIDPPHILRDGVPLCELYPRPEPKQKNPQ